MGGLGLSSWPSTARSWFLALFLSRTAPAVACASANSAGNESPFFKQYEPRKRCGCRSCSPRPSPPGRLSRLSRARMMALGPRRGFSMDTVQAQPSRIAAYGCAEGRTYAHLKGLHHPTLVVNGNHDPTPRSINSYLRSSTPRTRSCPLRTPTRWPITNIRGCSSHTPGCSSTVATTSKQERH